MEDATAKLVARYDRDAPAYHELWAPVLRTASLRLLRALSVVPAQRVIDVGTGVGALLREIRRTLKPAFLLGIDRSPGMLALAPRDVHRAIADARCLPVACRSVDLVLLVFMLFHLPSPLDGLREARRVLRRQGRVGTVTWGGELESEANRIWTDCLETHGAAAADPATQARDEPLNTPEKMQDLLLTAGFSSARGWAEDLVITFDVEQLVSRKTRMGSDKPRFESLNATAQQACLADARRRMRALAAEDFVARGKVVYAVASID